MRQEKVKEAKRRVLSIKPGHYPEELYIDNTLEALQDQVEGNIEIYSPMVFEGNAVIICNDEGKLFKRYEPNRAVVDSKGEILDIVFGTFLISAYDHWGEGVSLTDEQIKKYYEMFKFPEIFYKDDKGEIRVVKYEPETEDCK